MSTIEISEGRVLTARQFAEMSQELTNKSEARSEAQVIIDEARAEAQNIIEQARRDAEETERKLREMSDESLHKFLNEDAVDLTARALGNLLEQARQIRADLDAAQTWVVPLVRRALKRIIGTVPEDVVLAGAISQSLNEVRDRWDLVLRCHPTLQRQLAAVIEEDPRLAAAIREVQVDRTLDVEDIRLVSAQGILDIGVNTQIETFVRAVEQYLVEDGHA